MIDKNNNLSHPLSVAPILSKDFSIDELEALSILSQWMKQKIYFLKK